MNTQLVVMKYLTRRESWQQLSRRAEKIRMNLGQVLFLIVTIGFLSGCGLLETQYKGTARDLMPETGQLPSSYKLKDETTEIFDKWPGPKPLSSLKREYLNTDLGCHGFGVYFMTFVYSNKEDASMQYFLLRAFLENNKENPPTEMESDRIPNTGNSTLLTVIIPDNNSDEAFVEVWRIFQKNNVTVVSQSYGCAKKDNPQPLMTQRIEETASYAKMIAEKIR